jgi:hypothetical protein
VNDSCNVCQKKRARRACPGVGGDICPSCCGTQREVSIDCPLDCAYLIEAREHERPPDVDPASLPNPDIRVTEDFVRANEHLFLWLGLALTRAMQSGNAVDADAREALEALIRTYRTRDSGLIYESRPANPYAAALQDALKRAIEELNQRIAAATGVHSLKDRDVLHMLVFFQRLEYQRNNGRRRGRAFASFLAENFRAAAEPAVTV